MDKKELKKELISMRNSIQDFLDNLAMDEVDKKPAPKKGGKPEKPEKGEKEDEEE